MVRHKLAFVRGVDVRVRRFGFVAVARIQGDLVFSQEINFHDAAV